MNFRFIKSHVIRKLWLVFLIVIFVVSVSILINNQNHQNNKNSQSCFDIQFNDGLTIQEVTDNKLLTQHKYSKNIFFHETSCFPTGIISLNPRQSCAIESAALLNPSHQIFVLYASPIGFRNSSPIPLIDALQTYPNVNFNYLNITRYAEKTPLSDFIRRGDLYKSIYFNSHTSDVLRFLSLWKYGGTYLDLDIVMLQSLDDQEPKNYAGAESDELVAVGIINLENQTGHEVADLCINDLMHNFNGNHWANNGPGVLTRVLYKICGTEKVNEMIAKNNCKNFRVLPVEKCYSIHFSDHDKFFKPQYLSETLHRLSTSLIAHVWNKFSYSTKLTKDSEVAYIHLARKFCPKTLKIANDHF